MPLSVGGELGGEGLLCWLGVFDKARLKFINQGMNPGLPIEARFCADEIAAFRLTPEDYGLIAEIAAEGFHIDVTPQFIEDLLIGPILRVDARIVPAAHFVSPYGVVRCDDHTPRPQTMSNGKNCLQQNKSSLIVRAMDIIIDTEPPPAPSLRELVEGLEAGQSLATRKHDLTVLRTTAGRVKAAHPGRKFVTADSPDGARIWRTA